MKRLWQSFAIGLLLCATLGAQQDEPWDELVRQGIHFAETKNYQQAEDSFQKALEKKPDSHLIHYNLAVLLQDQNKTEDAIKEFSLALGDADDVFLSKVYYNLGNCRYHAGDLNLALDAYKKALKMNPADPEARANLELVAEELAKKQISEKAKKALETTNQLVEKHLYRQALDTLSAAVQDDPAAAKEYQKILQRLQQIVQIAPQSKATST